MISDHNCIDETKGLIIKWTNCLKSEFGEKYPEGGWYCHNVEGSDWISFESKADHEKRFEHSNAEQRALRQANKIARRGSGYSSGGFVSMGRRGLRY